MTAAEWCIFASLMLSLLSIASVKWLRFGRFDNSKPRDPAFYESPFAARALGAHQNGIEAFPFFAAAVLLAEFRACPQNLINELAVLFVIVRIAYVFTYIGNRPTCGASALPSISRSSSCRRCEGFCRSEVILRLQRSAVSSPRNDARGYAHIIPRRERPSFITMHLQTEGAGNAGCPLHP
jgi:uncharacterized MAPEG superfamily protein